MGENSPHARVHTPAMHHHHLRAAAEGFGVEGVFYSSHSAFSTSKIILLVLLFYKVFRLIIGLLGYPLLLFFSKMKMLNKSHSPNVGRNKPAPAGVSGNLIRKMFQLSRHSGMDRRNPDCRDALNPAIHIAYLPAIRVGTTRF